MSHFRLARISLMLAAIGLNAAPALMTSAHAQAKPAAEAPKETVRPELYKLLDPAKIKALVAEKKFDEAKASVAAAEAFPNRSPFETYVTDRTKLLVSSASADDKSAMTALEAVLASGRLDKQETIDFTELMATYHFNAKDYPKAIEWFKRSLALQKTDKATRLLINSYYLSNDFASAKTELQKHVAELEAKGAVPDSETLRLLASAAAKLKDMDTYNQNIEKLVTYYPSDEFWSDMVRRVPTKAGWDERMVLDMLRLQSAVLKQMEPEEYVELAELALLAGFFTEAKKTMDDGFAKGVLGKGKDAAKHKQLQDKANKGAADDARTIASGEANALKAKTGLPMFNLGYAYVTMDQFDKGLDLMEKGLAKGGLKNPADYKLRLGVAYVKAGRKEQALKVFDELKSNSGIGNLARYWTMHLTPPKAAAAAPAATTTTK